MNNNNQDLLANYRDYISTTLTVISHDLQNPLTNIELLTTLITHALEAEQHPEHTASSSKTPTKISKYLSLISQSTQEMRDLFTIINELQKIISTLPQPAHFSLVNLVTQEIESLEYALPAIKSVHLSINIDTGYTIWGDEKLISQALHELLKNAYDAVSDKKSTAPITDPSIVISAKITDNQYVIKVWDNGYGVNKHDIDSIFTPFAIGISKKEHYPKDGEIAPGKGRGLAIVNAIANGHGGSTWCQSSEDDGTTFFIALPLPQPLP